MALPVGVTTATCTVGVPVSFTGAANIRANVSVKPSVFLVHAATGTPLVDMLETIDTTDGVAGQFTLPHTDQAGFVDESQNTYTNWFYTVTIQYSNDRHVMLPKTKVFQLTTGQTLVDLDKLPSGVPALPYTAPAATVTSVVGLTGPVTGAQIAADPALSATYGPDTQAASAPMKAAFAGVSVKRALRPGPGNTVAIGDSLTAWDGDGSPLRQRDTWFQQLCARTNQRIRYGGVYATGSYKLSDIRTNHLPSVLALDPTPAACFIFGGTNTETAGVAAGFPVLIDIAQQLEAKGIAPVLVTLLPRSDANNTNHQNWNNGLRTLAAKRGWLLYDPAPSLLTTAGALNTALYADSAPAVHPVRPAGHTAMAKRGLTDDLAVAFPKMRLTCKEAGSANNLLPFNTGLFLTDSDANGLADNWSAAGTNVTYALVAPTVGEDVVGNWQKVTRTTGGATSTVMQRSASTGFVAGDRVALSGRFKATVEGTGSTYTVQAQWTGAPGSPHSLEPIYTWENNNDGTFYGEAIVPTGTTSINVQVALSVPTSGIPEIQVAELTLVNLSTGSALLPV